MYTNDLMVRWKRVYCVLENKKLNYYGDLHLESLEGCIDFDFTPILLKIEPSVLPRQFRIEL